MTPHSDPPSQSAQSTDNIPPRPAMPSGTLRARRMHNRYRKGKPRVESSLAPAAPSAPEFKIQSETKQGRSSRNQKQPPSFAPPVLQEQAPHLLVHHTQPPETHHSGGPPSTNTEPHESQPSPPTGSQQSMKQRQLSRSGPPQHLLLSGFSGPEQLKEQQRAGSQPACRSNDSQPVGDAPDRQHTPQSKTVKHIRPSTPAPIKAAVTSSPKLIVDLSPQSQLATSIELHHGGDRDDDDDDDGTLLTDADDDDDDGTLLTDADDAVETQDTSTHPVQESSPSFDAEVPKLAANILAPSEASRARPLICQDITNSNADTLRISRLPRGVTYDRLLSMVEPFGEVEELAWTASDPYVCDVTYLDPAAAREAKHFLGDALVGSDSEPPLKAELRSRDPGAQLFVGDLTPDVTEEMLEDFFGQLVGEPVSALLKRDPESFSPIGYGFMSFKNESSANFALVAGHRAKIGNACVRVGRAERNTHLYVSDLAPDVSRDDIKDLFGRFGSLVEEDTVIVRRSYAFIRYKNRGAAEKAKRTLDKTDLKGRLSVRYAEAEPLKACVAVQFHSSVPRPPNSLRDLLSATFSKHGNCSVQIPRLQNGMWRKVAFVTFHGEPIAANLAALEAVQSIRFVSSLPVCCQFARELIPRLPSRGMQSEKLVEVDRMSQPLMDSERLSGKAGQMKKTGPRSSGQSGESGRPRNVASRPAFETRRHAYNGEHEGQPVPDFVPVYVPLSALQHPGQLAGTVPQNSEVEFPVYQQQWQHRMMLANNGGVAQGLNGNAAHFTPAYASFPSLPDRAMRW